MSSINFITVIGRLTHEPKFAETKTGLPYCQLSLAVTTEAKTKEGVKEDVCFITATVWDKKAIAAKNLKKGQEVMLAGRLKQDTWNDAKTGEKKSRHSIQVSDIIHAENMDKATKEMDFSDELPF